MPIINSLISFQLISLRMSSISTAATKDMDELFAFTGVHPLTIFASYEREAS